MDAVPGEREALAGADRRARSGRAAQPHQDVGAGGAADRLRPGRPRDRRRAGAGPAAVAGVHAGAGGGGGVRVARALAEAAQRGAAHRRGPGPSGRGAARSSPRDGLRVWSRPRGPSCWSGCRARPAVRGRLRALGFAVRRGDTFPGLGRGVAAPRGAGPGDDGRFPVRHWTGLTSPEPLPGAPAAAVPPGPPGPRPPDASTPEGLESALRRRGAEASGEPPVRNGKGRRGGNSPALASAPAAGATARPLPPPAASSATAPPAMYGVIELPPVSARLASAAPLLRPRPAAARPPPRTRPGSRLGLPGSAGVSQVASARVSVPSTSATFELQRVDGDLESSAVAAAVREVVSVLDRSSRTSTDARHLDVGGAARGQRDLLAEDRDRGRAGWTEAAGLARPRRPPSR